MRDVVVGQKAVAGETLTAGCALPSIRCRFCNVAVSYGCVSLVCSPLIPTFCMRVVLILSSFPFFVWFSTLRALQRYTHTHTNKHDGHTMLRQWREFPRRLASETCCGESCLVLGKRSYRKHLSPDRTFNETIADRQARFRYEERHVTRPHHRFTYDPTTWNTRLTRLAQKKSGSLRIVERLQNLQGQALERDANLGAISRTSSSSLSPLASSIPSADDSESYSLRELVERLPSLRSRMRCPRHARGRLSVASDRARQEYTDALLAVVDLLEANLRRSSDLEHQDQLAEVSGTASTRLLSFEAVTYMWSEVLRGLDAVVASSTDGDATLHRLRKLIDETFLCLTAGERDAATLTVRRDNAVEQAVEEAFIHMHPLLTTTTSSQPDASTTYRMVDACISRAVAGLRERIAARSESVLVISAEHLALLLRSVRWSSQQQGVDVTAASISFSAALQTLHITLKDLVRIAESGCSATGEARSALSFRPGRCTTVTPTESGVSVALPEPPLSDMEVLSAFECSIYALETHRIQNTSPFSRSAHLAESHLSLVARACYSLLDMLHYVPNYDLSVDRCARWLFRVCEADVLQRVDKAGKVCAPPPCTEPGKQASDLNLLLERSMCVRDVFLLLSRLSLESSSIGVLNELLIVCARVNLNALCHQVLDAIADIADPEKQHLLHDTLKDAKRLRGLVLQHILTRAPLSDLLLFEGEEQHANLLWFLVVADAPLRVQPWQDLAYAFLRRADGSVRSAAAAMLLLRSQCRAPQQPLCAAVDGTAVKPFVDVDEVDQRLINELTRVVTQSDRTSVPDWDTVAAEVEQQANVFELEHLAGLDEAVVRRKLMELESQAAHGV